MYRNTKENYIGRTNEKAREVIAERLRRESAARTGKKIAVVGSGPAGLAAAFTMAQEGLEVILVDGGSRDRTVEIAVEHGIHVIQESQPGYGRACAAGVNQAQGDVVVFMDADGADDRPRRGFALLVDSSVGITL